MLLSEDHIAMRDAVRAQVQAAIASHAAAWVKSHHFPAEQLKGLAELGCYRVAVVEALSGADLNYLALALSLDEISAGDGATSTVASSYNCRRTPAGRA